MIADVKSRSKYPSFSLLNDIKEHFKILPIIWSSWAHTLLIAADLCPSLHANDHTPNCVTGTLTWPRVSE
jgi:hypothetical protein